MSGPYQIWYTLAIALGIGLLIGAERERRKGSGPQRAPAGIRTFAVTSLLGAIGITLGDAMLLAVITLCVAALCAIAYRRNTEQDPGLTTEAALLLTLLLGALATREPALASGVAVTVAILLAARTRIHHFVRTVLTEDELNDALVLAAASLIVLPLIPDRHIGPFAAINPRTIWTIVILMMSVSAAGYIALRLLGARFGLPAAGLASGFVSSIATIGAMGERVKRAPDLLQPAVAGAVLSTVATFVQMGAVLAVASGATLRALWLPIAAGGAAAAVYGALFTIRTLRQSAPTVIDSGRAFSLKTALLFSMAISAVLVASAALDDWLGRAGVIASVALAGLADTHSAAVSVASLVAAGKLGPDEAVIPILVGLTTNTLTKVAVALTAGTPRFAAQVIPGLLFAIAATWLGAAFVG